ncbi:Protein STRUBBELIG-RECEPTOR FAMILY 8 [Linum perenne]
MLLHLLLFLFLLHPVHSTTDSTDVQALQVVYTSLNSPSQLTNWKSNGGDPCAESWKGVTCQGSSVVSLQISGLGLSGSMGYLLSDLTSLKTMDLSNNNFRDTIPYQMPPNLTSLNLARNNLSGNLPYSLSTMASLGYLNVSGNSLSQAVGDVFTNLSHLNTLDLSFNNFSGDLPASFTSLSNLSTLNVQDNQLTGSLNTLTGLPLTTLKSKTKEAGIVASHGESRPARTNNTQMEMQEQRMKNMAAVTDVKPLVAEKSAMDKLQGHSGSIKRLRSPMTATSYTVATLQTATNSFSQEFLIGEGSLGRVYRAEFPNGKTMAVKKIDNAALSLQEEDDFLESVSNMSRLRHPNIVSLVGYCVEHGQRLLVYEYIGNGNLHDILHFADEDGKKLNWNARVRVALGTARALEYLHEVCLPSVVHRNFKSANILLDEELNPHLSDCGLAALTPNTERQVSTQVVGSFGYSAPEFALSGVYTVKSDVYSFGVAMLELLTGRKPLDSSRSRPEQSLVRWATPQLHDIDALSKMVDPTLNGMYPAKSLSRFADIIALCVQPEPEFRPPMSEVVQALVRLVQRASVVKRRSSDESGFSYRTPDHDAIDLSF